MRKFKKRMLLTLIIIAATWTAVTLFVEVAGPKRNATFGKTDAAVKALIVYDPDPFYNLDQQVSEAFAKGLEANGWFIQATSVAAARETATSGFDLYVFCANTYNWSPDWSVTSYIKHDAVIKGKKVVAITLGAGSTGRSQKVFENLIKEKGGNMLASRTYWLWRPNDKSRLKESNVTVAVELAENFGNETGKLIADGKR